MRIGACVFFWGVGSKLRAETTRHGGPRRTPRNAPGHLERRSGRGAPEALRPGPKR